MSGPISQGEDRVILISAISTDLVPTIRPALRVDVTQVRHHMQIKDFGEETELFS
jgi:hypothetical protein